MQAIILNGRKENKFALNDYLTYLISNGKMDEAKDIIKVGKLWNVDGFLQDCSIASALALEILQSYTKPSIWQWWSS